MQQPAIQVRNLRKSFRKRNGFRKKSELWAIDDVSFSVAPGRDVRTARAKRFRQVELIRILSTC
jgi:ABC-type antimicrobial peptide transport system ATPase subunit